MARPPRPERETFCVVYLPILLRCILYKVQIEKKGINIHVLIYTFTVKICTNRKKKKKKKKSVRIVPIHTHTQFIHPTPPSLLALQKLFRVSKTVLPNFFSFSLKGRESSPPSPPFSLLPFSIPSLPSSSSAQ